MTAACIWPEPTWFWIKSLAHMRVVADGCLKSSSSGVGVAPGRYQVLLCGPGVIEHSITSTIKRRVSSSPHLKSMLCSYGASRWAPMLGCVRYKATDVANTSTESGDRARSWD